MTSGTFDALLYGTLVLLGAAIINYLRKLKRDRYTETRRCDMKET